jgi:hypothetical protein
MPTGDISFSPALTSDVSCSPYPYPSEVGGCSISCINSSVFLESGTTYPLGYVPQSCVCATTTGRCLFIMLAPSLPNYCDLLDIQFGGPTVSTTRCSLTTTSLAGLSSVSVSYPNYDANSACYLENFCSPRPGPINPIIPLYHPAKGTIADIICEDLVQNFTDTGDTPTFISIGAGTSWSITV